MKLTEEEYLKRIEEIFEYQPSAPFRQQVFDYWKRRAISRPYEDFVCDKRHLLRVKDSNEEVT